MQGSVPPDADKLSNIIRCKTKMFVCIQLLHDYSECINNMVEK